jgi:solute carrier family 25 protein 34/35
LAVGFLLGGFAALGAGFFTNPLAVVKRVLQLQGELQELGRYKVRYRGFFHSFHVVAKGDKSLSAAQRSCPCAVVLNVSKLCDSELCIERGWSTNKTRQTSAPKCIVAVAGLTGFVGSYIGNRFYLIWFVTC